MDTVKHVKKIVEGYQIVKADEENISEISAVMALFNIKKLEEDVKPSATTIEIVSTVVNAELPIVMTEVVHCEKGSKHYLVKRNFGQNNMKSEIRRLVRLQLYLILKQLTGTCPGSWGILEGVRPTKIIHKLLDQGAFADSIPELILERYAPNEEKAALITEVAINQRAYLGKDSKTISLYIGIPYCPTRCLYCSFPGNVLPNEEEIKHFMLALEKDIISVSQVIKKYNLQVETIYVGGGTPTSLPKKWFQKLLLLIKEYFWHRGCEFTVEAGRPDSLDNEKISLMSVYHVNRISLNPQTMNEKTLMEIGRRHTVRDIIDMFGKIRQSNIPIINMDIIAGLPGETVDNMAYTLQQLALLKPDNITVHTLTIKNGSKLKETLQYETLPDVNTTIEMVSLAHRQCRALGMVPYYLYRQHYMTGNLENVGFAKRGTECIYNIKIMEERQTIIGIGPAAGTKAVDFHNWRLKSTYHAKDVQSYINNLEYHIAKRQNILKQLFDQEGGCSC